MLLYCLLCALLVAFGVLVGVTMAFVVLWKITASKRSARELVVWSKNIMLEALDESPEIVKKIREIGD